MHSADKIFNDLRDQGYKYFIVPSKARSKILCTKAEQQLSLFGDLFKDDDIFDEFKLTDDFEKKVFKVFPKNTFIKL